MSDTDIPNQFYFCGHELPLYSDYWWCFSEGLFDEYHELSFWQKQLCSYFSEIEWKLDKDRMPYSYDSEIFSLSCLRLLRHVLRNKVLIEEALFEKLDFDCAPKVIIDNICDGLLMMIEIAKNHTIVWWINGEEQEKLYLLELMESSTAPHQIEKKCNVESSRRGLSRDIRHQCQKPGLDKMTKRKIYETIPKAVKN